MSRPKFTVNFLKTGRDVILWSALQVKFSMSENLGDITADPEGEDRRRDEAEEINVYNPHYFDGGFRVDE